MYNADEYQWFKIDQQTKISILQLHAAFIRHQRKKKKTWSHITKNSSELLGIGYVYVGK